MKYKPKVLFPFVEAGKGHIMPMRAVTEAFEEKYGKYVEIIRTNFFGDSGVSAMEKYEKMLSNEVKKHNLDPHYGYFSNFCMDFFGTRLSSFTTMLMRFPISGTNALKQMRAYDPDLVFSTHWATNYYAHNINTKPLSILYCPDARINTLFRYPSDIALIPIKSGYEYAKTRYKMRFNDDNLKLVSFPIRREAYEVSLDKKVNRKELNVPENNFTVMLAEGGYGIGKMQSICEELVKMTDLNLTVIAICGTNKELYDYFCALPREDNITFLPVAYSENIFPYYGAADLYLGKSGSSIAEPCFFGVPQIITKYATQIEQHIGEHYINEVGSALKIFDLNEIIDKIREFYFYPDKLKEYSEKALKTREYAGADDIADIIWNLLLTRYPKLGQD